MIALSERGLIFLPSPPPTTLGQTFEEEFKRVWGKYFPYILLGAATFVILVLLRRLK
jgi:hypothetical protein